MTDPFRPTPALEPTPSEIAEWVRGTLLEGERAPAKITGLATLERARPTDLGFAAAEAHLKSAAASPAGLLLVPKGAAISGRARIEVGEVWPAVAKVMARLYPPAAVAPGVHPTAVLGKDVQIGEGASIGGYCVLGDRVRIGKGAILGPHCAIDADCTIGDGTRLFAHVTLQGLVEVGRRAVLHPGVVLGADGFKFEGSSAGVTKIPQVGRVVLEDEVELGACTTVDRAFLYETRIGYGTKIDNHVQVGHNCTIGRFVMIAGCCGIAGSVEIGDLCLIGGNAMFSHNVSIGRGCKVAGRSGILKNFPPGSVIGGFPAIDLREHQKNEARVRRLAKLMERVARLEAMLKSREEADGE